jgi:multiple antibiotic resistance protein
VAEAAEKDGVAVVPLGIPLIAGPGAISTVIIYAQQATRWCDTVFLLLTSVFVAGSV